MNNQYDMVCTNPDCDYRQDISNPNQKSLTSDDPNYYT